MIFTNKSFIDSNICVYAFDKTDITKRQKAFDLISQSPVISSQVVIETYNVCYKKLKLPEAVCEENTLFLCDLTEVAEMNTEVFKKVIELRRQYLFSFLDACIIASACLANCSILYSEDMQHNLVIEKSLTIINPFI
jgi:predicted nucleic acid-binding protein